jgi:cold-inducible RNA-binding protein
MGNKLYVGNLPYDTNEDDLTALFAQAGTVSTVNVMRDRETGRARGFAFVEMATDQEAQAAINQLHEHNFGGRTLTVNEARPQQPRSGGGGGFGGGGGGRGGRGGGGGGGGGRRQEPRW